MHDLGLKLDGLGSAAPKIRPDIEQRSSVGEKITKKRRMKRSSAGRPPIQNECENSPVLAPTTVEPELPTMEGRLRPMISRQYSNDKMVVALIVLPIIGSKLIIGSRLSLVGLVTRRIFSFCVSHATEPRAQSIRMHGRRKYWASGNLCLCIEQLV